MYVYYRLLTLTLNTSGGASETIEKMTKEVDGKILPCTKEEAELKFHDKLAKVGGNPATQSIKCTLFDPEGHVIKVDDVTKPVTPVEVAE